MRRNRLATLLLLLVMLAFFVSGCAPAAPESTPPPMTVPPFVDRESAAKVYDLVALGDRRADVEVKLGSPGEEMESEGGPYTLWRDGMAGVSVVFWPDGTVRGKTMYFDDMRQLCGLTGPADLTAINLINKNDNLNTVLLLMGQDSPGMEIAAAQGEDSNGIPTQTRLIVWANEDGSLLQVDVTQEDKVSDMRVYVYTGEGGETLLDE